MKKKSKHKKIAYKTVCGRCGNDIRPKAKFCSYCRLKIQEPGDILRVRADSL